MTALDVDTIIANSYRDFHVKGFDYICLRRSSTITDKLYFFDGDVRNMPEVVNPHDHRYAFKTVVMAGRSENIWYEPDERGRFYYAWNYLTPLNGGGGFSLAGEQRLLEARRVVFAEGESYAMRHDEIHTIRLVENETVLMLRQFKDEVEVGSPTFTFTRADKAPVLDGLYNRFTADQVLARLRNFEERTGWCVTENLADDLFTCESKQ